MRTDAQRNYAQLLAVAAEVFAEHGTEASLRDVARRAEVGIGTLYRHFPTRDALLQALLASRFDALAEAADGDDLRTWLHRVAFGSAAYRGLPASVLGALRDETSELHASCEAMRTAGAGLLAASQQAGQVRGDVTIADLLIAATSVGWSAEQAGTEGAERQFTLLMDGLRVNIG
ncbi:TetR/AcrR family transcriptional regulator [Nonomuraea sp. NPDC050556]|uniref:TetR/AcrR family transcriptional regulator n=1 Tax=Nonomuraea sp. NPDC050556 TaxID=3364369 RepID=UPI00379B5820